jgi:hypothetical protein
MKIINQITKTVGSPGVAIRLVKPGQFICLQISYHNYPSDNDITHSFHYVAGIIPDQYTHKVAGWRVKELLS